MGRQLPFGIFGGKNRAAESAQRRRLELVSRRDHRSGRFESDHRLLGDRAFWEKRGDARGRRGKRRKQKVKIFGSADKPLIYLITRGDASAANFAEKKRQILQIVKAAAESKISLVQIREKNLSARLVIELAHTAAAILKNSETKLLVNDRADIALAAECDGVHLTENSLSVEVIRENFPKEFIIGVSTHSPEGAEQAKLEGADFVTFSPIFDSPGKGEPQGLKKLRDICAHLKPFPVVALGGIDETNWRAVLKNGASGFAGIRFLNEKLER